MTDTQPSVRRTTARRKARQLAKHLRAERPDYAYLKQVFRHLREELGVEIERAPRKLPHVPTEQEIRAFYEAVWIARRGQDVVMIKTLLYTGVRVSELVRIHLADVDLDSCRIRIEQVEVVAADLVVEVYLVQPATEPGGAQLLGVLPLTALSLSVDVEEKLKMPPPSTPAVLPLTVLLLSVVLLALLLMPPPSKAALLPLTMLSMSVSVFERLKMPPPDPDFAVLPLILLSLSVTPTKLFTLKMPPPPSVAVLPLTLLPTSVIAPPLL